MSKTAEIVRTLLWLYVNPFDGIIACSVMPYELAKPIAIPHTVPLSPLIHVRVSMLRMISTTY